eukprot:975960-Prorocentrum_minimum.AAC.1
MAAIGDVHQAQHAHQDRVHERAGAGELRPHRRGGKRREPPGQHAPCHLAQDDAGAGIPSAPPLYHPPSPSGGSPSQICTQLVVFPLPGRQDTI